MEQLYLIKYSNVRRLDSSYFVGEYAEFYSITAELFARYTTTTIEANPYTRLNLKAVTKWSQKIVENLKAKTFDGLENAVANLEKFTASVIVSNPNMYYHSFEYFNEIIDKTNKLPDEAYTALANDTAATYYASITDEQTKKDVQKVFEEYFEIEIGGATVWKNQ